MGTTRSWLGGLALVMLAAQSTGCELIYVAIASAGGDDDYPIDVEPSPLCASVINGQNGVFEQVDYSTLAEEGAHVRAAGRLGGKGLARADSVALFFTVATDTDDYQPLEDLDVTFESSGKLSTIEWELCPSLYDQAVVVAHPKTIGSGKITVLSDGDVVKTFSFDIGEPTSIQIVLDANTSTFEAQLLDDAGEPLYAGDILWQFAPFSGIAPTSFGNVSSMPDTSFLGTGPGPAHDVLVTASRGDLTASVTVRQINGQWQIVTE